MLRFVQEYAQELSDEIYGTYNFTWGYDLYSLQLLCETGTGTPFCHPQTSYGGSGVAEMCGDAGERPLRLLGCPGGETAGSSGVRHSVSTKILVEPVTVRTRSTFPLAIQL